MSLFHKTMLHIISYHSSLGREPWSGHLQAWGGGSDRGGGVFSEDPHQQPLVLWTTWPAAVSRSQQQTGWHGQSAWIHSELMLLRACSHTFTFSMTGLYSRTLVRRMENKDLRVHQCGATKVYDCILKCFFLLYGLKKSVFVFPRWKWGIWISLWAEFSMTARPSLRFLWRLRWESGWEPP